MLGRGFVRTGVCLQASRAFARPANIKDSGFNPKTNDSSRASEIEGVEVTEDNYFDIFERDSRKAYLLHCVDEYELDKFLFHIHSFTTEQLLENNLQR